ncbi:hypothetical protein J9K13_002739 [Salmonella enterica]|nr:hypothetical protein [Salmonella enterica]HEC8456401.1 hypothetical protein [Salmonella enterica subsp. enterica serovar Poona]
MEKISLADFVNEIGQQKAAFMLGVHQTAISKALRVGREIFIRRLPNGEVKAEEIRPFPGSRASGNGN